MLWTFDFIMRLLSQDPDVRISVVSSTFLIGSPSLSSWQKLRAQSLEAEPMWLQLGRHVWMLQWLGPLTLTQVRSNSDQGRLKYSQ